LDRCRGYDHERIFLSNSSRTRPVAIPRGGWILSSRLQGENHEKVGSMWPETLGFFPSHSVMISFGSSNKEPSSWCNHSFLVLIRVTLLRDPSSSPSSSCSPPPLCHHPASASHPPLVSLWPSPPLLLLHRQITSFGPVHSPPPPSPPPPLWLVARNPQILTLIVRRRRGLPPPRCRRFAPPPLRRCFSSDAPSPQSESPTLMNLRDGSRHRVFVLIRLI
jgi:hypothetical protein